MRLNEALLDAAERLGFIYEVETLDAEGKRGKSELQWNGEGGLTGYLMWLGLYHPTSFAERRGRSLGEPCGVSSDIGPIAPLAFVSLRIIAAIVDGTAPADLTVTGLAKALPCSWVEQQQSIGLLTIRVFSKPQTSCRRRA